YALHSFPTRRSSDLKDQLGLLSCVLADKEVGRIDSVVSQGVDEILLKRVYDRQRVEICHRDILRRIGVKSPDGLFDGFLKTANRSEEHTSELQSREN